MMIFFLCICAGSSINTYGVNGQVDPGAVVESNFSIPDRRVLMTLLQIDDDVPVLGFLWIIHL